MNALELAIYEKNGHVYELFVKRGLIAGLLERNLLPQDLLDTPWHIDMRQVFEKIEDYYRDFYGLAEQNNPEVKIALDSTIQYLFAIGQAHGLTIMRKYLDTLTSYPDPPVTVEKLWCPIDLISDKGLAYYDNSDDGKIHAADEFRRKFRIKAADHELTNRGCPARSDFLMILRTQNNERHLFVGEISLSAAKIGLNNMYRGDVIKKLTHALSVSHKKKSVFSILRAEIDENVSFKINDNLKYHLKAFAGRDKPLYKLCQASSYTMKMKSILEKNNQTLKTACAAAITFESFEGILISDEQPYSAELAQTLADAYVGAENNLSFKESIQNAYKALINTFPPELDRQLRSDTNNNASDQQKDTIHIQLTEKPSFTPQSHVFSSIEDALSHIDDDYSVSLIDERFREAAKKELDRWKETIREIAPKNQTISLRDSHKAAIHAFFENTPKGSFRILGLPGSPGIGKTTAIQKVLLGQDTSHKDDKGFLFLYFSPRTIVNRDIFHKMCGSEQNMYSPNAIAISTDSRRIKSTPQTVKKLINEEKLPEGTERNYKTTVVYQAGDPKNFMIPASDILYLNIEDEKSYLKAEGSSTIKKVTYSEDKDVIKEKNTRGVMQTVVQAIKESVITNPHLNQITAAAAIQSYRHVTGKGGTKSTIDTLCHLFDHKDPEFTDTLFERADTVVIMLDELTGDSAGVELAQQLIKKLYDIFFKLKERYGKNMPKFVIVLSDASLTNDNFLRSFLSEHSGDNNIQSPARLFVGRGRRTPFDISISSLKIGEQAFFVYNVMANCFPAQKDGLEIQYNLYLDVFRQSVLEKMSSLKKNGSQPTNKNLLRKAIQEKRLQQAMQAINKELSEIQDDGQIIFFAQDKEFLAKVKETLEGEKRIDTKSIMLITSKIDDEERKKLLQNKRYRDSAKIFLITSSAARGISFPNVRTIIAEIPQFMIENSFMEIVQLIYRGRGKCHDGRNGDNFKRKLVFLLAEKIVIEEGEEEFYDDEEYEILKLQKLSNLVTTQMLLRGSLHTRINGDLQIQGNDIAFVPVGENCVDEVSKELTLKIREFIKAAKNYRAQRSKEDKNIGLTKTVLQKVQRVFANSHVSFIRKTANQGVFLQTTLSTQDNHFYRKYLTACSEARNMLPNPNDSYKIIPKNVEVVGNILIEKVGLCQLKETFFFDSATEFDAQQVQQHQKEGNIRPHTTKDTKITLQAIHELKRDLYQIARNNTKNHDKSLCGDDYTLHKKENSDQKEDYDKELRDAAQDLYEILDRDVKLDSYHYTVEKYSYGEFFIVSATWPGCPATEDAIKSNGLSQDDLEPASEQWNMEWANILQSLVWKKDSFSAPTPPNYKTNTPWVICHGNDPWHSSIVFSNRYFAASHELNLLNVIL
ncbi:C-terminal helicase domain-containing protein [Thermovirga lienii]|uniref:C-terminal helicase domain-containing protein n=1 Tax=Thermovirga lienii TaxID=336261 RepID=UPI002FE12B75